MAVVYIVEDDGDIREMESYALTGSGYSVRAFEDGTEFFKLIDSGELPDLVLLDIMLPGEDGMDILKRLRTNEKTRLIPIIMVTAKSSEADKVCGLDSGADDYIAKPFGIMELVSRINALLRRTRRSEQVLSCGDITIDESRHRALAGGVVAELTFKEYELLKFMLRSANTVLTRERLMDAVWGFTFAGESRTVDMHIMTLRQKLGSCGKQIITVRNVGYMLTDEVR